MQFIDQSAAYTRKSITLDKALAAGRAKLTAEPGSDKLAICFRPELKIAIAFDLDIDDRVDFKTLPTPDKLDLMIDDLLPRFFHPDLLPLTGRAVWHVRFVIDGSHRRTLRLDDRGLHDVSRDDPPAEVELETDILTLMALLRAQIAEFHHTRPPYPQVPRGAEDGDEDFDDEVWGN